MMLFGLILLVQSDATHAQSSRIAIDSSSVASGVSAVRNGRFGRPAIRSSISQQQLATEALLAQSVSAFGFDRKTEIEAGELFDRIGMTAFIDFNLDGLLDEESRLEIKPGCSMLRALEFALLAHEASLQPNDDGTVTLISIDDLDLAEYMKTVTYDVTPIAPSFVQAQSLCDNVITTILADSWQMNGSGDGVCSIYEQNGRQLVTITQSYQAHRAIRKHFADLLALGGVSTSRPVAVSQPKRTSPTTQSSSVVSLPSQRRSDSDADVETILRRIRNGGRF